MTEASQRFLRSYFGRYYKDHAPDLPPRFARREFGFFHFGGSGMQRPVAFATVAEAQAFLARQVPMHAYYSSAYYQDPSVPMAQKKWMGADLVFDLDADHVKGAENMTYAEMLAKVKDEFRKLIDRFLVGQLGYAADAIGIVFSGGRGYHAHISDPRIVSLTSTERREIVDLVRGLNLDYNWAMPVAVVRETEAEGRVHETLAHRLPGRGSGGWRGLVREALKLLQGRLAGMSDPDRIKYLRTFGGVGARKAQELVQELSDPDIRGVVSNALVSVLQQLCMDEMAGELDEPVTCDVRRLIRLPGTLHGKTGFVVKRMTRDELDGFEPLRDGPVAVRDPQAIRCEILKPVNIQLGGESYSLQAGPAELPEPDAAFFVGRGEAKAVG